ncbi:hypothetical protein BDL97_11G043400 [Sphagnum fallax]|nr:hypothetical protein BDL97_11G043400 [Sphagnum fallax]
MHSNGDFGCKGRLSSDRCLSGRKRGASSANRSCKLCAVKKTLSSARRLHDQVQQGPALISPLQSIMVGSSLCVELEALIEQCLDCSFSTVLDSASSKLAAVRRRRQQNMSSLEALLKQTAMMVADKGGMDSPLVTRRRARLCVAVRASHKGLLSGGVTLDVSNSGATLFMEPEPALEFNNEEIRLAAAEQAEETAVLQSLTFTLIDMSESMIDLLQRVTALDLACARAGYAMWLNAVRPVFCENDMAFFHKNPYMDQLMVDIEGARHPLLLGTALSASLNTQWHGVIHQNKINTGSSSSSISTGNASSFGFIETTLPVPIDIKICESVKVVTITGPNTGGKTATLKTLGVIVLMAKAGLFVPAVGQPQLPWFDRILADIGDDQSLERSLSTFSGHIRRVCEILEAGTKKSLVLLDEIGGGTDPSEGAALATAVLGSLASSVQLTLATTHSAELRRLKDQDPQFENASVEFDVKTLRPTYRVLWGVAGQSNALDIAASLGFDQKVLTRARELVTKLVPATLGERTSELMVPLVKQRDEQRERAQAAGVALASITKLHYELQAEVHNLAKREAKLRHLQEEEVDRSIMEANARMEQVLTRFQELVQESGLKENPLSMRDAQAAIATIAEEYNPKHGEVDMPFLQKNGSDGTKGVLAVGDKVVIRRLGKLPATVVEPPQGDSEYLTVQLGALKMKVKASEIITRGSTGASGERSVRTSIQLVKPIQSKQPEIPAAEPKYEVAVQTSRNTLDLRGCRVEESLQELDRALASRAPQSVLFVVHGMGTGAVKEAVWKVLKKHPYVAKFEQESIMNPGCTIVYIK